MSYTQELGRGQLSRETINVRATHKEKIMSSIAITFSTEGPKHDPYHVSEVLVERSNGDTVLFHRGLGDWIEVNGERDDDHNYRHCEEVFERVAGVSVNNAERAYERMQYTCKKCGGSELRTCAGFPGETFYMCCRCDILVSVDFNESAII